MHADPPAAVEEYLYRNDYQLEIMAGATSGISFTFFKFYQMQYYATFNIIDAVLDFVVTWTMPTAYLPVPGTSYTTPMITAPDAQIALGFYLSLAHVFISSQQNAATLGFGGVSLYNTLWNLITAPWTTLQALPSLIP